MMKRVQPFRLGCADADAARAVELVDGDPRYQIVRISTPSAAASPVGEVDGVLVPACGDPADALSWLSRGIDVLAMVPLGRQGRDHDTVLSEATQYPGSLLVGYRHRLRPAVRSLVQLVADGQLGRPGLVRMHVWRTELPDLESSLWRDALDTVVMLAADRPCSACTVANTECTQVHVGFQHGAMAIVEHARVRADAYDSLSVIGSRGAAHADDHANAQLLFGERGAAAVIALADMERGFIDCFADGVRTDISHDLRVGATQRAAVIAARDGIVAPVALPDE